MRSAGQSHRQPCERPLHPNTGRQSCVPRCPGPRALTPQNLFISTSSAPCAAPWAGVSNRDRNISSRCCHQIQHIIRLLAALNHFRARRFLSSPGLCLPSSPTPTRPTAAFLSQQKEDSTITTRWENHNKPPQKVHCNHQLSFIPAQGLTGGMDFTAPAQKSPSEEHSAAFARQTSGKQRHKDAVPAGNREKALNP